MGNTNTSSSTSGYTTQETVDDAAVSTRDDELVGLLSTTAEVDSISKERTLLASTSSHEQAVETASNAVSVEMKVWDKLIDNPENHPRLCNLKVVPHFQGYGFEVQSDDGEQGEHFISLVDDNSPASIAGLRAGDRIIEVNGESVDELFHEEVVDMAWAIQGELNLLILDGGGDVSDDIDSW